MTKRYLLLISLIVCFILSLSSTLQAQEKKGSRIVFSAINNGQWDIFSVSANGTELKQLTNDVYEDSDPAFSPDGTHIAYASRRNKNWDIYLLNLANGQETRLTTNPHYDGAPNWHPTGNVLAFESQRSDDLDIWLLDTTNNNPPHNLTADSTAGEFNPTWHNNGETLFFASWREGHSTIWSMETSTGTVEQLTRNIANTITPFADTLPVWDSAGQKLAFIRNSNGFKDIFWLLNPQIEEAPLPVQQFSWVGSIQEATFSSDGKSMAAIWQSYNGAKLVRLDENNPIPTSLTPLTLLQGRISWHPNALISGVDISTVGNTDTTRLYQESLSPSQSNQGEPYDLVRLNDLRVESPWLADTVDDSYQALRRTIRQEVGYDFLGEVSETLRPINFYSDTSQYSSWHKSGRAVDLLFELPGGRMQLVQEKIGGETYWRVLLRCEDQSGKCGKPVIVNPWDYSYQARNIIAPEQGGFEKENLYGYYLDFTTQAKLYGWQRIASYTDDEFNWTWHFTAFEYWHYQKNFESTNGVSNWYQAMLQVYPQAEVDTYFNWQKMRAVDEDPYLIVLKGVPLPAQATRWWQKIAINY